MPDTHAKAAKTAQTVDFAVYVAENKVYVAEKNDLFPYLNPERRAYTHFAALHEDSAFVIFFHNALGK